MKKLILILCIISLSLITNGQPKIDIGIKGGLNFSKVEYSTFNPKGKTGYHAGAFALFKFSKIGLQPEIIFSQVGSKADFDNVWKSSYISIPIIVKLYIAGGLNLQVGPQFGFLNKAELNDTLNIKSKLKEADFSLAMGVGFDAPFRINFTARYNLGLRNINNNLRNGTFNSQVFQLSVGFKLFNIGK